MTTVVSYLRSHPKSELGAKLRARFGATSRRKIVVGHGLVAGGRGYGPSRGSAHNAPQSNISQMLKRYRGKGYVVGGAAGRNARDGNWFAIYF